MDSARRIREAEGRGRNGRTTATTSRKKALAPAINKVILVKQVVHVGYADPPLSGMHVLAFLNR